MKRGRTITRLLPLVAGPLCALALAVPATAASGPPLGHAPKGATWAKWSPPATPKTTPSAMAGYFTTASGSNRTYNSSGGSVLWSSGGVGLNQLTFAGLGGITGGNVEVSDLSEDTCVVQNWFPSAGNLIVNIDCYNYSGAPANGQFSVIVTQPTAAPHGALAYDWSYNKSASYTPTGVYQYNSAHKKNHIAHLGTGQYAVVMPGVGTTGTTGTVKVSAYGAGGGDCQLKSWYASGTNEVIFVNCYAASGVRQNRNFVVSYARSNNLMGQNGLTDANALADHPGKTAYLPHIQFNSHPGSKVSLTQFLAPHVWVALFAASGGHLSNTNGGGGNVQITAQSANYTHCFVFNYGTGFTPIAELVCLDNSGHIVASKYTIQWVTR